MAVDLAARSKRERDTRFDEIISFLSSETLSARWRVRPLARSTALPSLRPPAPGRARVSASSRLFLKCERAFRRTARFLGWDPCRGRGMTQMARRLVAALTLSAA